LEKDQWKFLSVLVAGIVTSLFSVAKLMMYLLRHHPISVRSFFFGLILISAPFMFREIKKWNGLLFYLCYRCCHCLRNHSTITNTITGQSCDRFFAGALAICAMVLPGFGSVYIIANWENQFIVTSLMILIFCHSCFITGCLVEFSVFPDFKLDSR